MPAREPQSEGAKVLTFPRRVKAVLFDLDGTLVEHEGPVRNALAEWIPTVWVDETRESSLVPGFGVTEDRLVHLVGLWFTLEDKHYPAWRSGEISFFEQRRRRMWDFLPHLGVDPGRVDLDEMFAAYEAAYERNWVAYPDARPALEKVRALGMECAVLTNGSQAQQAAKLKATGLSDLCPRVFASGGIGVAKPELAAYTMACDELGMAPTATMMVGDNYELDVVAPRAAGLLGVHLDRSGTHRVPDAYRITSLADLPL